MSDWKNKTCETCTFRVGDECLRFPPNGASGMYPVVENVVMDEPIEYQNACAEHSQLIEVGGSVPRLPGPNDDALPLLHSSVLTNDNWLDSI